MRFVDDRTIKKLSVPHHILNLVLDARVCCGFQARPRCFPAGVWATNSCPTSMASSACLQPGLEFLNASCVPVNSRTTPRHHGRITINQSTEGLAQTWCAILHCRTGHRLHVCPQLLLLLVAALQLPFLGTRPRVVPPASSPSSSGSSRLPSSCSTKSAHFTMGLGSLRRSRNNLSISSLLRCAVLPCAAAHLLACAAVPVLPPLLLGLVWPRGMGPPAPMLAATWTRTPHLRPSYHPHVLLCSLAPNPSSTFSFASVNLFLCLFWWSRPSDASHLSLAGDLHFLCLFSPPPTPLVTPCSSVLCARVLLWLFHFSENALSCLALFFVRFVLLP